MAFDDPTSPDYWLRELTEQAAEMGSSTSIKVRERQSRFLAALARTSAPTKAAAEAGVSYGTTGHWCQEDPVMHACREMAKEAYADRLITEGTRRAVEGIEVTIRDRHGNVVGSETKYSDDLLKFLLRGLDKAGRFSPKLQKAQASDEEWRTALLEAFKDEGLLAQLDGFADKVLGRNEG